MFLFEITKGLENWYVRYYDKVSKKEDKRNKAQISDRSDGAENEKEEEEEEKRKEKRKKNFFEQLGSYKKSRQQKYLINWLRNMFPAEKEGGAEGGERKGTDDTEETAMRKLSFLFVFNFEKLVLDEMLWVDFFPILLHLKKKGKSDTTRKSTKYSKAEAVERVNIGLA